MMSASLLGSGFTVEVHNVTTNDGIEEVKTFRSFIPTTFTQLEYSHYVQEVNHIATSKGGSTVIDDFNRIGEVTATFISHPDTATALPGVQSENEIAAFQANEGASIRSRKGCYACLWPPSVGCETNPDKKFGVGLEADLSGIHIVVRYKVFRVRFRVFSWSKRHAQRKRRTKRQLQKPALHKKSFGQ